MKSVGRCGVWAVVLMSGALGAVVSCGSDDDKRKSPGSAGGQGGAGESGISGHPEQPPGGASSGAAGEPSRPSGGAGGEAPVGVGGEAFGGAGAPPTAGAGGEAPVAACAPSGVVEGLEVSSEATYSVCRGARPYVPFEAVSSPASFVCCAQAEATPTLSLELSGKTGDGGGDLLFEVPADAPVGTHYLTLGCAGSIGSNDTLGIEITDTPAPLIDTVTEEVYLGGTLTVTGTNLGAVTFVGAKSADGFDYPCQIDQESQSDTSVSCSFAQFAAPEGTGYELVVYQNGCGYALGTFKFDIVVPS